ncbi:MAG: C4-dicarboxylate ABC transporter substrate-binding protein, partial [Verrucomicrobia bacterium]|nr:C4-dicarboxylate ABC transporter substrate-binding protein [Verrucomicrobiota bacterium]
MVTENFGVSRSVMLSAALLIFVVIICGVFWFIHSAPPDTVVITSGPEGSVFQTNAVKYASILARNGVKLKILPSQGSQENLLRLNNPAFHVDVGFVQGGMTGGITVSNLVSLGSVSYQPLFVFYRNATPLELLSEFTGKRLAVGQLGSGTRSLAMTLLQTNGVGGATVMLDLPPAEASKALLDGNADAVFLMGDSASMTIMRKLLRTPGIHLFNFKQAAAYTRRLNYLNVLTFPMGSIDLGSNIPPRDANLLGPTVELITRKTLHPAMSDLLLEAAREVHGRATILQRRGEFPAPLEQEF